MIIARRKPTREEREADGQLVLLQGGLITPTGIEKKVDGVRVPISNPSIIIPYNTLQTYGLNIENLRAFRSGPTDRYQAMRNWSQSALFLEKALEGMYQMSIPGTSDTREWKYGMSHLMLVSMRPAEILAVSHLIQSLKIKHGSNLEGRLQNGSSKGLREFSFEQIVELADIYIDSLNDNQKSDFHGFRIFYNKEPHIPEEFKERMLRLPEETKKEFMDVFVLPYKRVKIPEPRGTKLLDRVDAYSTGINNFMNHVYDHNIRKSP